MSNSNNIDIIPTEVEYIHDLFAYNKEFKTLICTSYKTSIKKLTIESYITLCAGPIVLGSFLVAGTITR